MAVVVQSVDGPNLRIVLASGLTEVDVQEIYSEVKEWQLTGDNTKYPEPFLPSVGGEELSGGINAGSYFFLNNAEGWRLRPAEEDATVLFNGNLAPADSTKPLVTPTLGDFTVLWVGLQPITQSVNQLLTLQQETSYNGEVWIDDTPGVGVSGTSYPIGTASEPVDNLADAITIAGNLGIRKFKLATSITLTQAFTAWVFEGVNSKAAVLVNGQDITASFFLGVAVSGAFGATTGNSPIFQGCTFPAPVTGAYGIIINSNFGSTVGVAAASDLNVINGTSAVPGTGTPSFTFATGDTDSQFRNWTGGISIGGMNTAASNISIDVNSGNVILEASNLDGTIVLRGVGTFTNNLPAGPTLNRRGFVDGVDVRLIRAIDAGRVTITGSNPFVVTIYDDDDTTVLAVLNVSADGRTRTRIS